MKIPKSIITPTYDYVFTVYGYHVFRYGVYYSIDEHLEEPKMESFINYLIDEGYLEKDGDWIFLP